MKKRFGDPLQLYDDHRGIIWMDYKDIGPVPDRVDIPADKKTQLVRYVEIQPDNLSLRTATELFGNGFKIIRYDFDNCLDKGGEGPIFESEKGALELVVYLHDISLP